MNLKELQKNWNVFGKKDPFWAILTNPSRKGNLWKQDEFFETGQKEIEGVLGYLQSLNIECSRKYALDFGCGVGRLTQALAAYFDEAGGVDIAPSMIKLARQFNRFGDRCKYYLNETEALGFFDDNTFDFIYSNLVLQHMRPQYSKSYMKEFLRVLKPGGVLVFQLPSEMKNRPVPWEPPVHDGRYQTMREMKRFIKLLIPKSVLDVYYYLRYEDRGPVMEMHCIQRGEVLQFLVENNGKIIDVVQNDASGAYFISFRYCVTKG